MKHIFSSRKLTSMLVCAFLFLSQLVTAQSYTYQTESFEESVWSTASSSSNAIAASTGTWTVAKNNIQTNAYASGGTYSLICATKTNALTSPILENGAGVLTYYANRPTGGGRTITVHTSTDKVNWSAAIETYSVTSEWTLRRVEINDPAVRYITFSTNSNGGVYLDDILITSAGSAGVTATIGNASDISQTAATVSGSIANAGSDEIIERGFCYSTTEKPDVTDSKVVVDGAVGDFSATLSGLTPGATYYVKAYATTSKGSAYSEELAFSTRSGDAPVQYWLHDFNNSAIFPSSNPETEVSFDVPGQGTWLYKGAYRTTNAAYIQDGSASNLRLVKNGSYVVTPLLEDGVSYLSFYEGRGDRKLTIYTSTDGGGTWNTLTTVTTVKVVSNVVTVNSGTINRIKIANESGSDADIDNLSVAVFPMGDVPVVTTGAATAVAKTTATVGGEVVSEGTKSVVERGLCWGTNTSPLIADNKVVAEGTTGGFSLGLTGLPAGRKIYVRAYATSRSGTGYGNEVSFTTDPATIPVLTTVAASAITAETAIAGGEVTDAGGAQILSKGICWSTQAEPTNNNHKTVEEAVTSSFTSLLSGLTPNTVYYYRAYAQNEAGVGYGNTLTFTTGSVELPAVTTSAITGATSYKIKGGGVVTSTGNAPVVCGLCWNTTGNPTVEDAKTTATLTDGLFTDSIGNLQSNTTYYVRAYVTNSAGTAYGNVATITTAAATVLYISPQGNDATADGSIEKPFFDLQKAVDLVAAGDTIYMLGGTYKYALRINIRTVGEADGGTIYLGTRNGERALLDFSSMVLDPNNQGIRLTGSYWYMYGLDIKGAGDNGLLIERNKPSGGTYQDIKNNTQEGHHNVIEFCSFYDNKDTGLQMKNMAEYNRVINCDSYHNRDAEDGNADGFAPKLSVGTGNYFYGCRAWNNSDDGWDGILYDAKEGFDDDMTTIYENCWAFNNGFLADGSESKGNGNGFKLGGSGNNDRRHNAIMIRCLAFDNLMKGFDQNHNTGDMYLLNCTGFSNKYLANKNHFTYKIDEDILAPGKQLTLTNCVAVWDGVPEASKSTTTPLRLMEGVRTTCDFLTSASDYVNTDTTGVRGPRQADGSLPNLNFMKPRAGNMKLIDAGTIVEGLTFLGEKPDLGCFEVDEQTGIEEVPMVEEKITIRPLLVYPRPATDHFYVRLLNGAEAGATYKLAILDLMGKEVHSESFVTDEVRVDASSYPAGMYIVRVTNLSSGKGFGDKVMIK
ncbi:T9SS C-terminal target domain-containing protein [Bacteroides sp. 214]|uniref:right-handed parallel beta-helix repeat-containing protein n=1 Tax=Bacteroides sp. 214 TaxID=2302935 RepID=UPI0013D7D83C|nr:T9SS type A sorting domain-containing protein [Bacteroides sp. 214]NDW13741.1 T9SS C-terminal target domain-containing protein [Bacteroides sp. 214]